jgi:hypothetical protein
MRSKFEVSSLRLFKQTQQRIHTVSKLATRTWAHSIVIRSGLNPSKLGVLYIRGASEASARALFYRYLNDGIANLGALIADKKGWSIALAVDDDYPGTLKVLMNPLWEFLVERVMRRLSLNDLHARCVLLDPAVRAVLMDEIVINRKALISRNFFKRNYRNFQQQLDKLFEIGSLDALAGAITILLEGELLGDKMLYESVKHFLVENFDRWSCFKGIPDSLRIELKTATLTESGSLPTPRAGLDYDSCCLALVCSYLERSFWCANPEVFIRTLNNLGCSRQMVDCFMSNQLNPLR